MIWPTAEEERLLRAALSSPTEALDACHALHDIDVRRLRESARRLLPLLYVNLQALELHGPLLEVAEREYRRTASRNAALFDHGRALVQNLETAGVATMVLKGTALVTRYYRDAGVRPMADLDLLIPSAMFFSALAGFQRAGWTPSCLLTRSVLRTTHAVPFTTPDGFTCDLHWRVFPEPAPPGGDDALWAASVEVDFCGAKTRALSSADQLLHVCVHGAQSSPVPALWWVSDAIAIIRAGDVSWDRLISQAVTYRFVLRLREALQYLRNRFGADVPGAVFDRLRTLPVSALERFEWRVIAREHRMLGALPRHWCLHLRSAGGGGLRGWLGFLPYLRDVWGLKSTEDLPRAVATRAVTALRRLAMPTRV
jgi:putative nucleotidyltransferase-like protein